MAALDQELAAFERARAALERDHMGKWVLFHGDTMVGLYDGFEPAAEAAVAQFGRGPYLIKQIGAPPVVLPASVMYRPVHA